MSLKPWVFENGKTARELYEAEIRKDVKDRNTEVINHLKPLATQQLLEDERISVGISQFFDYREMASKFVEIHPIYYDKTKNWWIWSFKQSCWRMIDETDVLNYVDKALDDGIHVTKKTTRSQERFEILESLKRRGRLTEPEKPKSSWIQFNHTVVDVKTKEEFAASPKYFFTNPAPWDLGTSTDTPEIDRLFKEWVVKDGVQDETYIQTLKELCAYALLRDSFLQRLFALTGAGSNGKGCFLQLLSSLVGDENVVSTEMKTLTSNRFASSDLFQKSVALMGEVDAYDMKNTTLIKQLTGGDKIRYEFKGKGAFSDYSFTTVFIATNSLPKTNDSSIGFYRRWLIVDFPHTFPVGENPLKRISSEEMSAFCRQLVNVAYELYQKHQFTNEGEVEERMKRYEERSNPLNDFIRECCEEEPESHVNFNEFEKRFNEFLKSRNLRQQKRKDIKKALKEDAWEVKNNSHAVDANGDRIHVLCVFGLQFSTTPHINAHKSTRFSNSDSYIGVDSEKYVQTCANVCEPDESPLEKEVDMSNIPP